METPQAKGYIEEEEGGEKICWSSQNPTKVQK
jgi:hypothetical protein